MRYWIEVRYPVVAGDFRNVLYFSEGPSYERAMRMSKGDEVLYYETKVRPGAKPGLVGSQTIHGRFVISGDLKRLPPHEWVSVGGRTLEFTRAAEEKVYLNNKQMGIPLSRVKEVLGNRPMYCMEISKRQFEILADELERRQMGQ